MKNKLLSILLCAVLLLFCIIPCSAGEPQGTHTTEAQNILADILQYLNAEDTQNWINKSLIETVGAGTEWYILALSHDTAYDFSSYETALLNYLSSHKVSSASSRLKYALCLLAIGSNDDYISQTLNDSMGKQGIISWVFGLHLINNNVESTTHSLDEVISTILSMQCEDGGFSITGQYGDVDTTAMTIQALASYYSENTAIRTTIDKAITFLSEKQLENGDYSSYGVPNPESTAQVLTALSTLGIDGPTDERFIKNGNTLLHGIEKYRLPDGSFSHEEGGETNGMAVAQAFFAMVSYLRYTEGNASLYLLDPPYPPTTDTEETSPLPPESTSSNEETAQPQTQAQETVSNETEGISAPVSPIESTNSFVKSYKFITLLVIIGVGGSACLILLILKKRESKSFLTVLLLCFIATAIVFLTDFQTPEEFHNTKLPSKENIIGTVTMSIRCDTVAGKDDHIPENGIILDITQFEIAEGDTAYTLLAEAARKHKIQFENDGTITNAYISGINSIYEFDYGNLSGWIFLVNGEQISVGAGHYTLKDGDLIEWHYSCDLGRDITPIN